MAANTTIGISDPSVARQFERQTTSALTPTVTGPATVSASGTATSNATTSVRSTAPVVSGSEVIYPQAVTTIAAAQAANSVTITQSANNESGDITTVYSTPGSISVTSVDQRVNQYSVFNTGVSEIIAGNNITISATIANGKGEVTINATGGNGNYSNSNVASYLPTYTGNVGAGNVNVTGTVYANGISSTGLASLTTLNVSATANLGAVGNVKITGGTSGQKLTTDGAGNLSWTNDANSSYGDSNVVTLLSAFGSNNISTTGNVSIGNLNVSGNVTSDLLPNANITYDLGSSTQRWKDLWIANSTIHLGDISLSVSNSGQLSTSEFIAGGEGIGGIAFIEWTTDSNLYIRTNSNSEFNATFASLKVNDTFTVLTGMPPPNTVLTVNNFITEVANVGGYIDFYIPVDTPAPSSNTFIWTFDLERSPITSFSQLSGNTITLGNAIISSNGNSLVVDSIQVTNGNIGTIGNIASLNLNGSNSNVLYGNGVFAPAGGGNATLPIANGNSNINIATANGNVTITSAGNTWTIGTDGALTAPNGSNIYPAGNNFNAFAPAAGSMQFYSDGGNFAWSLDGYGVMNLPFASALSNTSIVYSGGNFRIDAGANNFVFTDTGLLTMPGGNVSIGLQYGSEAILASNVAFGIVSQGSAGMTALQWTDDVSNTSQFSAVYINDVSANVGDIQIRTGAVGNANIWKFGNDGNLTLPSNTFSVNYANGTQVSLGGGGNTGNVTFDNVTVQGVNGLNLSAGSDFTANLAYLQVRAGDVASHIHLDTGNNSAYDLIVGDDQNYVQVSSTGNILLSSYDSNTAQYTWTLDYNGNLILAGGNSVIQSIANSSLDPLNPNVSTMTLTPDANYSSQVLVLDPTAPGHIHLRALSFGNIDDPAANIFLGGEATSFEITYGSNNQALIHSNNYTWTFGNDGTLLLPRDASGNTDPYLWITGGNAPSISSVDVSLAGPANFQIVSDYLNLSGYSGAKVAIKADNGEIATDANMVLTTNGANVGNTYSWTFATDGSLTLPGNLVAVNASPAPVISGFSSVSALQFTNGNSNVTINANSNTWTFDSTGNLTIPGASGGVIKTVANGAIAIAVIDNGTDNPAQLLSINANGTPTTAISAYANNAQIQANINGSIKTWAFDNAGVTTFPVLTYANLSSATTAGRRAFISDANLAATGNFGNAVSGGGANTVPVYSDGSVWRIG